MTVFVGHLYSFYKTEWNLNPQYFEFFLWHNEAVDLFFILSGFVLNWVYFTNSHIINWRSYFIARIGRIIPLYYITFSVFLPIPIYSYIKHGCKYIGENYFYNFIANILMLSGILSGLYSTYNFPAWSIGIEFFCYAFVFPLLIFLVKCKNEKASQLFYYLLVVIISTCCLVYFHNTAFFLNNVRLESNQPYWNSTQLCRGIFGFTGGFFLCSVHTNKQMLIPSAKIINIIISISICYLIINRMGLFQHLPSIIFIFPIIVYFSAYDEGLICSFLKINIFQWLGERTYSIYMWHWPIMSLLSNYFHKSIFFNSNINWSIKILFLTLSLLIAAELSYVYIETPTRRIIRNIDKK